MIQFNSKNYDKLVLKARKLKRVKYSKRKGSIAFTVHVDDVQTIADYVRQLAENRGYSSRLVHDDDVDAVTRYVQLLTASRAN